MSPRQSLVRWIQPAALAAIALCMCTLLSWAQESRVDAQPPPNLEALSQGLGHLSRQIGQLRQTASQSAKAQLGQVDLMSRQVTGLEQSQQQLSTQLAELQNHSLQQIQALRVANDKLSTTLWALVGLLLMLLWRTRKAWRPQGPHRHAEVREATPQAPPGPLPQDQAGVEPPQSAPDALPAKAPSASPSAAPAAVSAVAEQAEDLPEQSIQQPIQTPSAAAAPWSALVAADLQRTEQALTQARQGFMQPARINP